MCGIVGFLEREGRISPGEKAARLDAMLAPIRQRGPDATGRWHDANVALGHNRLAIIDLSEDGAQPMSSFDGHLAISFNGEIYNYKSLRQELIEEGYAFRSSSDTEVLLNAVHRWGVDGALQRATGMFALAVWDKPKGSLSLARDRMGEKPLYYQATSECFIFGSEVSTFKGFPGLSRAIDEESLDEYFQYGYISSPNSIFKDVKKVRPGTIIEICLGEFIPREREYWSIDAYPAGSSMDAGLHSSDSERIGMLDGLIRQSVAHQMVADVPVGAFLSGGIDSSVIVAVMQAQSGRKIKTFSIGFEDKRIDESRFAAETAARLGTEHVEFIVSEQYAMERVRRIASIPDEPFADSSLLPTFLVSEMARSQVTVALSGDAGDELFGGYNHYELIRKLDVKMRSIPRGLMRIGRAIAMSMDEAMANRLPALKRDALGYGSMNAYKIRHIAGILAADGLDQLYDRVLSTYDTPDRLLASHHKRSGRRYRTPLGGGSLLDSVIRRDMHAYLPDDILFKVDRACMAVSLEGRVPLLDHRIVEFALGLDDFLKIRNGERKWILKQVLYRYLPKDIFDRPKQGFVVPLASWLRNGLREWARGLLFDGGSSPLYDLVNKPEVERLWREHAEMRVNRSEIIWSLVMLRSWLDRNA